MAIFWCYTETLQPNYQWALDRRPPSKGVLVSHCLTAQIPNKFPLDIRALTGLSGLFGMEFGNCFPFSFCIRGFPKNASEALKAIQQEGGVSQFTRWVTNAELLTKSAELLIVPDVGAGKIRPTLLELIKLLPKYAEDPTHQRIVFWWN